MSALGEGLEPGLREAIGRAAAVAAEADRAEGGHRNAGMMLALIAKAAGARRDGVRTLEELAPRLTDDEREYLGL